MSTSEPAPPSSPVAIPPSTYEPEGDVVTEHEDTCYVFREGPHGSACSTCGVNYPIHPRRPERTECPYCHNTIDVRAGRYEHHTVVGGPCSGSRQIIQSRRDPHERVPTSMVAAGLIADFNQGAREQVAWEAEQAAGGAS